MGVLRLCDVEHMFIHCSAAPNHYTAVDVDDWHRQRGFKRDDGRLGELRHIGYHRYIEADGTIVEGRDWDEVGAQVQSYNHCSWGVCLAGDGKFTREQWHSLRRIVEERLRVKRVRVRGHCEVDSNKTCPNFTVKRWLAYAMDPLPGHIVGE